MQVEFFIATLLSVLFEFVSTEKPIVIRQNSKFQNEAKKLLESENVIENSNSSSIKVHSRQKRFVWITDDGLLTFPPGTNLVVAPSLSLPFFRNVPKAFGSNLGINTAFTSKKMDFRESFRSLK